MTKKKAVDNPSIRNKQYLSDARARLMFAASADGFSFSDIAIMFGVDKSVVSRIFSARNAEYSLFLEARSR